MRSALVKTRGRLARAAVVLLPAISAPVSMGAAQGEAASPWQFGVGGGVRIPVRGTYALSDRGDLNVLFWFGLVSPQLSYGGPRIELAYHDVQLRLLQDTTDASLQTVEFSFNWMWITPPHRGTEVYLTVGSGVYENTLVLRRAPTPPVSSLQKAYPVFWSLGFSGGTGIFYGLPFGLRGFAEVRAHRITKGAPHLDGGRTTAVLPTFNLGVRF